MREVVGERDGFGIWPFSPLETLFAVLSIRLHFVSHFFSLSNGRCLQGKDNLGGEGVMQMERSMANGTCRSPSSQFPQFWNTCPLSRPG